MSNKILKIGEFKNKYFESVGFWDSSYGGYEIETEKNIILLAIDDQSHCCESFGHFSTNDNLQDFIGANIIKLDLSSEGKACEIVLSHVAKRENIPEDHSYEIQVKFVRFFTDKGDFELIVYNAHGGYYGHDLKCKIKNKGENQQIEQRL